MWYKATEDIFDIAVKSFQERVVLQLSHTRVGYVNYNDMDSDWHLDLFA
jgi:hypothetical protein